MYCPNCGKKVEGKFCCYCGHPLPVITESPSEEFRTQEELEKNLEKNLDEMMQKDSYQDIYQEEETLEESRPVQRKNSKNSIRKETVYEKKSPKKISQKKTKRSGNISLDFLTDKLSGSQILRSGLLLRLISFACMLLVLWSLLKEFWQQKNHLGQISQILTQQNMALAVFLLLSVLLIVYGIGAAVGILRGKKTKKQGAGKKVQVTTRGLPSFVFYFLLTFAARKIIWYLPGEPQVMNGLRQAANVLMVQSSGILLFSGLGIVCCICAKILKK